MVSVKGQSISNKHLKCVISHRPGLSHEVKQRIEKEVPLEANVYTENSIFVEGLHFYYSDYCITHRRYSDPLGLVVNICKKKRVVHLVFCVFFHVPVLYHQSVSPDTGVFLPFRLCTLWKTFRCNNATWTESICTSSMFIFISLVSFSITTSYLLPT